MASIVITGCSRGIGLELVKQAAATSSIGSIFATARSQSPSSSLAAVIKESHDRISYVQLDVENSESISSAAKSVEEKLNGKGVDILVNNAGIQIYEPGGAAEMHGLESTLNTNVIGVHKVSSAFLPLLKKGGQKKIINISSTLGSIAMRDMFAMAPFASYKISKTALNMLSAQYAISLEKDGFTVVSLSPGWLSTDMGGQAADLKPEQGGQATWDIITTVTPKDNGDFRNISFPGVAHYDGKNPPW